MQIRPRFNVESAPAYPHRRLKAILIVPMLYLGCFIKYSTAVTISAIPALSSAPELVPSVTIISCPFTVSMFGNVFTDMTIFSSLALYRCHHSFQRGVYIAPVMSGLYHMGYKTYLWVLFIDITFQCYIHSHSHQFRILKTNFAKLINQILPKSCFRVLRRESSFHQTVYQTYFRNLLTSIVQASTGCYRLYLHCFQSTQIIITC